MYGFAELDSKPFIDCQIHDKKTVEVIQSLNCSCNVIGFQRLGKYDKDKNKTRNLLVTFGSVWIARKVITKAIENKFFKTKNNLITTELSPNDLALERHLLAKRYELIRSGIDQCRLKLQNWSYAKTKNL